MRQLPLLVLIGIAGWLAWRYYGPRRAPQQRPVQREERPRLRATTLERDPRTGVYRPVDDKE